jgi:type I restriction enzyme S subunit
VKLKHVCSIYSDYGLNISADNYVDEGLPLIRTSDFDDFGQLHLDTPKYVSIRDAIGKILKPGDLLFSRSGTVGRCMVFSEKADATYAAYLVRFRTLRHKAVPRFVFYWSQSEPFKNQVRVETIESTIGNFNGTKFSNLIFPEICLEKQRAIVDFLDRETARIDQLIEKKQRLIVLLAARYGTAASDAVSGRTRHAGSMSDSGLDWIGELPAHWAISRVGWLQKRITYGFTNPMPIADEGPFLLTANDINDGRILYESARHTTLDAFTHELTDKSRPQLGDVLLTKDGTLGRVAVHDGREVCINQSVALLRPMPSRLRSYFLAAVLESQRYQDRLIYEAGGTAIKHIYITRVAKMPFPLPPLPEQDKIIEEVRLLRARYVTSRDAIRLSIHRLNEFRAALITAAVTGQLDAAIWNRRGTNDRRADEIEAETFAQPSEPKQVWA